MKLSPQDQQAVDFILDARHAHIAPDPALHQRIAAVQSLFDALDALGASDPSTNLIDLTLQRCEDAGHRASPVESPFVFTPPSGPAS